HVLGVMAGVLVVLLQQVAQQQGGAPVGAAELEGVGDPRLALAREDRQQPHQRQDEQGRKRRAGGGDRRKQPERSQQRVDVVDQRDVGQRLPEGGAAADPRPQGGRERVEAAL